jgi:hypothetical protein
MRIASLVEIVASRLRAIRGYRVSLAFPCARREKIYEAAAETRRVSPDASVNTRTFLAAAPPFVLRIAYAEAKDSQSAASSSIGIRYSLSSAGGYFDGSLAVLSWAKSGCEGRNGRVDRVNVPVDDLRGKISYFSFVVAAANTDSFSAVSLKHRYTEIVYPALSSSLSFHPPAVPLHAGAG